MSLFVIYGLDICIYNCTLYNFKTVTDNQIYSHVLLSFNADIFMCVMYVKYDTAFRIYVNIHILEIILNEKLTLE